MSPARRYAPTGWPASVGMGGRLHRNAHANRRERLENGLPESCDIVALTVGEPLLGQLPDSLVRIELRRIRWKALQVEALRASTKLPHEQATMKTDTVPE